MIILMVYNQHDWNLLFVKWLNSFSVPYDLSMGGSKEKWAESFLAHMQGKWEICKPAWRSLQMEVSELKPRPIAL